MDFRNTALMIRDKNYQKYILTIDGYQWIKYDLRNTEGEKFSTYIFDLKYFDAK
jgi:hypothetical protein